MIRTLFGAALPILGLGAATALLGPDLLTGPRGEPMTVAAPGAAAMQAASFAGTACAYPLVLGEGNRRLDPQYLASGAHVVTLAVRYGANGASLTIEEGAAVHAADETLLLVFNESGRIVAVGQPPSTGETVDEAYAADCLEDGAKRRPAGI